MLSLAYKTWDTVLFSSKKMLLRIKVSRLDFQAACSNGWVDGQLQGKKGMYIYSEIGLEQEYISSAKDDPKTSYRIFQDCTVFLAKSQEQLNIGDYEANLSNVTVIIYC